MFKVHNLFMGPVKMIGNKGYLLIQPVEGVAGYSPCSGSSRSNLCPHLGQTAWISSVAFSLILEYRSCRYARSEAKRFSIIAGLMLSRVPSFVMTLESRIIVRYAGLDLTLGSFNGRISSPAVASLIMPLL